MAADQQPHDIRDYQADESEHTDDAAGRHRAIHGGPDSIAPTHGVEFQY